MVEIFNTIAEMCSKLDPMSTLIVLILIIALIVKFKTPIMEFLRTYFRGVSVENGDDPNNEIVSSLKDENHEFRQSINDRMEEFIKTLANLTTDIHTIKGNQSTVIEQQNRLASDFHNFKNDMNDWKDDTAKQISSISELYDFLAASDREDKRSYIVREYNYFYIRLHKIDFYSREVLDKVYDFYLKEDGDTFVQSLMTAIRSLPVVPQITQDDINEANEKSSNQAEISNSIIDEHEHKK